MTPGAARLERAFLLLAQERYTLAEQEARAALTDDPDEPMAHGVLSLTLACQERFDEATKEAEHAIRLAPDHPFGHYVRGVVMLERGRLDEAATSAEEAIRLEQSPQHFSLLSSVRFGQRRWQDALEAADKGLALDAEDPRCANARGLALMQLGRKEEAHAILADNLARDPENAEALASRGWVFLDQGKAEEAMNSFREALRIDPTLESARAGIVEALKSRHKIYSLFLRYCLFMSKLSSGRAWVIIIGAYLGYRGLISIAESNPAYAPYVWPFIGLYLFMAILTWTADNVFTLLLRLNRFGRLSLSKEQLRQSNVFGGSLALALLFAVIYFALGWWPAGLGAVLFGVLIIPITGTFNCAKGWPRIVMWVYTTLVLGLGLLAMALAALSLTATTEKGVNILTNLAFLCFQPAIVGAILATWVAPALAMVKRRR